MIYDLIRNPGGPMVDTNRIYINGHSMGGSGSLALALRYPNVFAAAYASKPMTNYRTDSDWETDNVKPKWGNPEQNLPVLIEGPGDWADHLQVYNGTGVWDWQNHQAHLQNRQGDEMVPFGIVHGINDDNIRWDTQGRPAYTALNASRRAWGGLVTDNEHDWVPYQGVPPNLRRDAFLDPFVGLRVVRNETVPGLSNSSNNLAIPPATTGGFNQTLLWSSSWTPWDGPPVDTPVRWQISLCSISADPSINDCGTGAPQTVDVTPRRVQHFVIRAGMTYRWENRRVRDGELVASGQVTADSNGVLTVPNFQVSPAGNRLIISPVSVVHNYLPMIFRY
jgi:pimeloyl-ACP methyl ester carboxylesterase